MKEEIGTKGQNGLGLQQAVVKVSVKESYLDDSGQEMLFSSKCPDNCTFLYSGDKAPGFLINVKQYQSNNHISSNNDKQLVLRVCEEGPDHHSAIHLLLNSLTY